MKKFLLILSAVVLLTAFAGCMREDPNELRKKEVDVQIQEFLKVHGDKSTQENFNGPNTNPTSTQTNSEL